MGMARPEPVDQVWLTKPLNAAAMPQALVKFWHTSCSTLDTHGLHGAPTHNAPRQHSQ